MARLLEVGRGHAQVLAGGRDLGLEVLEVLEVLEAFEVLAWALPVFTAGGAESGSTGSIYGYFTRRGGFPRFRPLSPF